MEQPRPAAVKQKPIEQPKIPVVLSETQKDQFIKGALSARDEFVAWAKMQPEFANQDFGVKLKESWKNDPSKNIMLATLGAVGLANVGLTIAAEKVGLNPKTMSFIWGASFGAPILEELVFRSKKIPDFLTNVAGGFGVDLRSDHARLAADAIFTGGHFAIGAWSLPQLLANAGIGTTLRKIASEHGMTASIASHSLFNANMLAYTYFLKRYTLGPDAKDIMGRWSPEDLQQAMQGKGKGSELDKTMVGIFFFTQMAAIIGIGVAGVKEFLDDRNIQSTLQSLKDSKRYGPLDHGRVKKLTNKLLTIPSVDGYKFQSGVDLSYTYHALTMPKDLEGLMTPDQYARSQVHKEVMNVWKNPKTLPQRLEAANRYISDQIAKRDQAPLAPTKPA